jgi:hypothetical protein
VPLVGHDGRLEKVPSVIRSQADGPGR